MMLALRPTTLRECNAFLRHHRHSGRVAGCIATVGVERGSVLVAVGILGRTLGPFTDKRIAEITRVCSTGERNACSMIYGALSRAAAALGYHAVITYTLASENGASLRASGFQCEAEIPALQANGSGNRRHRGVQLNLDGEVDYRSEPRRRWRRVLLNTNHPEEEA
jgi:hypothetical protein